MSRSSSKDPSRTSGALKRGKKTNGPSTSKTKNHNRDKKRTKKNKTALGPGDEYGRN